MAKNNLVIVESPAKARTIERYLGSEFSVLSSFGHIRDLPKKGLAVDLESNFTPTYEISDDKKKIAAELKKKAKNSIVWLASDEDREGEAIAWHLCNVLGLDPAKTNRIVFHEITKPAILEAIKNPRNVDPGLVDAQQARRVLDRLVGYQLSPVLWKKVQSGLSAGRVQSVAVRLIVEREREIRAFTASSTFKIIGSFKHLSGGFEAELNQRPADQNEVKQLLEHFTNATFKIGAIDQKPASRNPSAPFITSTLQQEAARKLGYSVRQTMTLAQRLYESGHITYMRTDSTNLSPLAIRAIADYVESSLGKDYVTVRNYKTKNASAQEAHEAIRPTNVKITEAGDDLNQRKLYQLIWKRAVASQMSAAKVQRTEIIIEISNTKPIFIAKGEMLIFDGFMKVYGGTKDDVLLPTMTAGQSVELRSALASQTFSRPAPRYSEAGLVKKLEEMGIGRPSTYAPTISTVQDRGYVEKQDLEGVERSVLTIKLDASGVISEQTEVITTGADRGKLLPTHLAEMTTDFLIKHFGPIVDYDFTAKAEAEFDKIANGERQWQDMIRQFYSTFEPLIKKSDKVSRSETSQARLLGNDPKDKKPIYARYGRYGPMLQCGEGGADTDEKPVFTSMPAGSTLDTVTLEQALKMFELPRTVGTTEDNQVITANIGRYGPYIKVGSTFMSIKDQDPLTISEAAARKAYELHKAADAKKYLADFGTIKVINGRYGPYVTDGKTNAKVPDNTKADTLTESQAKELLKNAPKKRKFRVKKTKK